MKIARHVRKLEAYTPGEQPKSLKVVKLNTNENPYPPSPECAKVLARFPLDRLRRYPDPVFAELRGELAKLAGATPERIFVGNGSDEVLSDYLRLDALSRELEESKDELSNIYQKWLQ